MPEETLTEQDIRKAFSEGKVVQVKIPGDSGVIDQRPGFKGSDLNIKWNSGMRTPFFMNKDTVFTIK